MISDLSTEQLLAITAAIIVIPLATYTAYLFYLLYRQRRAQKLADHDMQEKLDKRRAFANDSIKTLLQALNDNHDQLSLTEAAIRITALSQILQLSEDEKAPRQTFAALAEATAHIPILDQWKQLSRPEKRAFDQERETLEHAHEAAIRQATRDWLDHFERTTH